MIISDLNYLEANEDEVFGGLFFVPNANQTERNTVIVREDIDIDKDFFSRVNVSGAAATSQAVVLGTNNSATQTQVYINNNVNSSSSVAFARY